MTERNANEESILADLLEQAGPRPAPSPSSAARARQEVHAEWQLLLRQRRRRIWLAAASVAALGAALLAGLAALQAPAMPPIAIADVAKARGNIFVQTADARLIDLDSTEPVTAGQTLVTGDGAAVSLAWPGAASLRLDANTEVRFTSAKEIALERGRVYFDSGRTASKAILAIVTDYGVVTNRGTQFMVNAGLDSLTVNVRDGSVSFAGQFYEDTVHAGERLAVSGAEAPLRADEPGHGNAWEWAEAVAPGVSFDGMSEHAFFAWVSRETGHRLQYTSETLEVESRRETLHGFVDQSPREALAQRVLTAGLSARFEGGVLVISN